MSIIAAGTTSNTALVNTGNTDGTLQLQVNGTTPSVTLATTGAVGVGSTPGYGTNGQVLTSSGSGSAPTWTTVASSQWTTSGSQVYFTGSIGVGTSAINSWYVDNKAIDMPAGSVFSYSTTSQFIGQNTFVNASGTQVAKNTGASAVYAQSAGIHQFASAPSVTANSTQTFTTILEFGKGKTLALESATSVSGTGISFPSTQSASTDANTLDDYEEGTWTPTVIGSTTAGTGTYTDRSGYYTKIGNRITINGSCGISAHTGTGNITLGVLPFTSSNETSSATINLSPITVLPQNITCTALNVIVAWLDANRTSIDLFQMPTGGGAIASVPMDTSFTIAYSGTYR